MQRRAHKYITHTCSVWLLALLGIFAFSACGNPNRQRVDELNERSYSFHYRSLDSTRVCAEQAYALSDRYGAGRAEALNNLAFVSIAKMDYDRAKRQLDSISTDNIIEQLVADVQHMRLCQRQSQNKLFYDYRERALRSLRRVMEERGRLSPHQLRRLDYATSEFALVESVYYYYVGLTAQSADAISSIGNEGELDNDTAQFINYLYNVGSGGIITADTQDQVSMLEFEYLIRCYQLALAGGYKFFVAQALQAMGEHLENAAFRGLFIRENIPAHALINPDEMPEDLLAGYLAQKALNLFEEYGDVYQTAGAYRTLAECYWGIDDYQSAEICLLKALEKDTAINQAPDLVASIREQLSLVYSAVDIKEKSDYNRNLYLDMQEKTRQDRQLESRADQLKQSSRQLNLMIIAVVIMIVLVLAMLLLFHRMRQNSDRQFSVDTLLSPLEEWKQKTIARLDELKERDEEIKEQIALTQSQILANKKRNLEQRAKVSLACSIMPFIDRIVNEVSRLMSDHADERVNGERMEYIAELTDKIGEYNEVLTRWIQMRQGEVSLHIESFPLQELFNMVMRSRMSFQLKGIDLQVAETTDVVKADKTLTLFMLNTIADNARKFTPEGGTVSISSQSADDYVEISVADTGVGMTDEQLASLFSRQPSAMHSAPVRQSEHIGYGFGLMNCKGIIEKYKKVSKRFAVCDIKAESRQGTGSRISFRLPKGIARSLLVLALFCLTTAQAVFARLSQSDSVADIPYLTTAAAYADSAYNANVSGRYEQTLVFADSCRQYLNRHYLSKNGSETTLMVEYTDSTTLPPELEWFRNHIDTNYDIILSIRNETAVAALALHEWNLYTYNNKVYTQLFREMSADKSLDSYCRMMQRSEQNKSVAIILLVLLLLSIFPAYYLLYYRHRLYYRYRVERVKRINNVLLSDEAAKEKLEQVRSLWSTNTQSAVDENDALNAVVRQIEEALEQAIDSESSQQAHIELAADELRRAQYENDRLHISNNVLDNCLSALKHETMYYPSRIRQLLPEAPLATSSDSSEAPLTTSSNSVNTYHPSPITQSLQPLAEVVSYYKELYTLLTAQAMHQTEGFVLPDKDMLAYLFDILRKQGGEESVVVKDDAASKYVEMGVVMPQAHWSEEECRHLFTPLTHDVDFLLCRQIVRDVGEVTNLRGCGIRAEVRDQQNVVIITLPRSLARSVVAQMNEITE